MNMACIWLIGGGREWCFLFVSHQAVVGDKSTGSRQGGMISTLQTSDADNKLGSLALGISVRNRDGLWMTASTF